MEVQTIIQLLGGVGIFLFAIKLISDNLQLLAGDRLRHFIGAMTRTPILGVLVGALTTVLIQSSSATTVMTVSFVDAGLMTLRQAIGVIMGANIGTTITGQIIAIKIKDFAYIFILIGVLLSFFGRTKAQKYLGGGLLGFGLLFVGMQTMESSMSFLRSRQDIFVTFGTHPLLGILAGTVLTLLVQSSSATVGLTIALGAQGLLSLEAAIAINLGNNIGTTITAILASLSTDRTAKQACAAHVLFNVIGVCLFYPFLPWFTKLVLLTADSAAHQIANAHTLFNVINTVIFIPFVKPFARLIRLILPDQPSKAIIGPQFLDHKLIATSPVMAIDAVKHECAHMGFLVVRQLDCVSDIFFNLHTAKIEDAEITEKKVDTLRAAIHAYAPAIWQAGIADDASRVLNIYLACSRDVERIGDRAKKFLSYYEFRMESRQEPPLHKDFTPEALDELLDMFAYARLAMITALDAFVTDDRDKAAEVDLFADRTRRYERELRAAHTSRFERLECDPLSGVVFIEILGDIEHIAYHANNLAKATLATTPPPRRTSRSLSRVPA